jgi:hypothetical protein
MRRSLLAFCCGAAVMANAGGSAMATSDSDMGQTYFNAAQSGDELAQFYLGALYASGVGRPQSDIIAVQWFTRAAEQGHAQAMLILSGLLALGRGTPKDYVGSYKWAYIVANGSRIDEYRNGSRQLMGLLETKMSADQIASAKSQALNFHAASQPSQAAAQPTNPDLPPPTGPALLPPSTNAASPPQLPAGAMSGQRLPPGLASKLGESKMPAEIGKNPQVNDLMKQAPEMLQRFGIGR